MPIPQLRQFDAGNRKPYINAAPATANGEVVVFEQLQSAISGLNWKDDVRVASTANVTITSPGASIDGITLTANDRVLLKDQTTQTQNGIYIWNGAAVAMTRTTDADTFDELEGAIVVVTEGSTNAGTGWRQTQVNGVIGTNNVLFVSFGVTPAQASETLAGTAEIATQAETDTGTDDLRIVTPLKLANYAGRAKRFSSTIGDGTATSIAVTHNLNTRDVNVEIAEVSGTFRTVLAEIQRTTVNQVTLLFDVAPAASSLRVTVVA
jgi:hypothetical protein